jgi:hypothetical protein
LSKKELKDNLLEVFCIRTLSPFTEVGAEIEYVPFIVKGAFRAKGL